MAELYGTRLTYHFAPFRCNVCILLKEHELNRPPPVTCLLETTKSTTTTTSPPTTRAPSDEKPLFVCSRCKLITYCGQPHQKHDWPNHKEFCRAIHKLLKSRNAPHILDYSGRPIKGVTKAEFHSNRATIKAAVHLQLQRDLGDEEREMLWFPKICASCYEYNPKLLSPCQQCECEFFCRGVDDEAHREARQFHLDKSCRHLQVYYNFSTEGFNELPFEVPLSSMMAANVAFPNNLFELINRSTNEQWPVNPKTQTEYDSFSAVCNFSCIATLLYVLIETATVHMDVLCVHIIGVHCDIALFTENECWLLFRWLPTNIRHICLHFIGPELRLDTEEPTEYEYDTTDLVCPQKKVSLHTYKQKYELCAELLPKPHCIIAYNCGFVEFFDEDNAAPANKKNTWDPALKMMVDLHKNVPIAFTSYVRTEAKMDLLCLRAIAQRDNGDELDVIVQERRNPYRDLKPYRNWNDDSDEPLYNENGYVSIVMVKN